MDSGNPEAADDSELDQEIVLLGGKKKASQHEGGGSSSSSSKVTEEWKHAQDLKLLTQKISALGEA